jgi:hypothetical protein
MPDNRHDIINLDTKSYQLFSHYKIFPKFSYQNLKIFQAKKDIYQNIHTRINHKLILQKNNLSFLNEE